MSKNTVVKTTKQRYNARGREVSMWMLCWPSVQIERQGQQQSNQQYRRCYGQRHSCKYIGLIS